MKHCIRHKLTDRNASRQEATRRNFLTKTASGLGAIALAGLTGSVATSSRKSSTVLPAQRATENLIARAKRVIYLFQSGGPSQLETFDFKPALAQWHGQEIPPSVRGTQRNSGMVTEQASFPLVKSIYGFEQYGEGGAWISEILPNTAGIADDLCIVQSMYTDAINHEPAVIFLQTGSQLNGRPSIGSWISYGLGSTNDNLPAFVVLISKGGNDQPLSAASWGSGFLPPHHQGVQIRSGKDPVLYLNNPHGVHNQDRRRALDFVSAMDEHRQEVWADPAISSKINQYEMAFRMQTAVPEVADLSKEPAYIFDMYGPESRIPGSYAANCLLARKLAEQDVRFIQLYHIGWDQHGNLPKDIKRQAWQTDQPTAALIKDLKNRGLLEDTLVVWGGEFGRTSFSQGQLTATNYGRDHHPGCFTMWMAGGGTKPGLVYGQTDELGYNVVQDPVHVHDFQATLLHLLGIDHEMLTYRFQGRRFRLTDVHGRVMKSLLA